MSWFSFASDGRGRSPWRTVLTVAAVIVLAAFGYGAWMTYRVYQSELPSFEQLHNIEPNLSTKLYDRNGVLLKEFYTENRALTPLTDMPKPLVEMLIASEDQEFYHHWGINLRRLFLVALTNVVHWQIKAGASTITQQVSRMLFLTPERTMSRKIKEALTAIKLERTYSKDEILEMYLNQHYFGRGSYGVAAAARALFDKRVADLNINDCAILIGLLKGPNINSPLSSTDKALQARNRVLYSYYSWGGITEAQFDSLKSRPVEISPPEEAGGQAPYFTETVRQYLIGKYGEDQLYSGGLKVYTSLDARLQRKAEVSLYKKIDSMRARIERTYPLSDQAYTQILPDTVNRFGDSIRTWKKIQGAFVAIDNVTGDVLSMIGGRSFDKTKFNRAVQALRQPGSAFKPFVYTACIDNGFHPTDIIDDNPIVLDIPGAKQWRPHNFDDKFMGPITLRTALAQSRNLAAIRLLLKINPEQAIFYAKSFGITTPLTPVPSLAIGVSEVKLIELVSAFSVFPNQGIHIPYRMILKIVDRYGRVLEDHTVVQKSEVLSPQTAYIMVDMMRSVVDEGTGVRARAMGFSRPAGGKTGTSNEFCDNWFVGFTPQITAGVWLGFDDKTSLGHGQEGSSNAVPVWTEYMLAAHDSLPIADFEQPDDIVRVDVCLESGELATDRCTQVATDLFTFENQPTVTCHLHPSRGMYIRPRGRTPVVEDTANERVHF